MSDRGTSKTSRWPVLLAFAIIIGVGVLKFVRPHFPEWLTWVSLGVFVLLILFLRVDRRK